MLYVFGDHTLDTERYELRRQETCIGLRPKVYDVLAYLVIHRDRVIPKEELLERLWPGEFVGEATLSSCIMAARKAMRDSGRTQHTIKTVHGRGFRFVASVEERPSPSSHDLDQPSESYFYAHGDRHVPCKPSFVGRIQQLDHLAGCLQDAMAGQPRLVLIEGEAGVGKTRLIKELETHARHQGVQVCYGRCYEDLAFPYLLFVESLFSLLEQAFVDGMSSVDADVEVIRWLRHPHKTAPFVAHRFPSTQDEQEKLRLLLAVSRTTLALAQRRPLCILLDDLHWADHPSLELFGHLVFSVSNTVTQGSIPLLIAATYRPPEPSSRLARFIPRFERESICQTCALSGFDESEIVEYIQGMGIGPPSYQLVAMIRDITQGNPLFMQEVLHHLVQNQALHARGGYIVTTSSLADLRLPTHITASIAIRIAALSQGCQQVLTLSAFLGERFSLQMLSAISGLEEEVLLDVLEEAIDQHLLLSEDQDFQFAHPLIRHVLYQTPSGARRQRWHQRMAQALESLYVDQLEAHMLEIAHHLMEAGSLVDANKVAAYARRAGDQAFATCAWGHAARYYEAALSASESIVSFPVRDRAELHYRAGLARYRDMDAGPALAHYEEAIAAYRRIDDRPGVARALMEQTRTYYTLEAVPLGTLVDLEALEAALEALGEDETELHGSILTAMSDAYSTAQQQSKAKALAQKALDIGRRLKDYRLKAHAYHVLGTAQSRSLNVQEGVKCFRKAVAAAQRIDDLLLEGGALARLPVSLMRLGQLREVETVGLRACELTRQYQDWGAYSVPLSALTAAAVAKGDFKAAEDYAQETMLMISRSHYPWAGERTAYSLARAHMLRGEWTAAEASLDILIEPGRIFREAGHTIQRTVSILRQLIQSYAGDGVTPLALNQVDVMISSEIDAFSLDAWCAWVELADFHQRPHLSEHLYKVLQRAEEQGILFSIGWICILPRILGVAAMLNHWWDIAETHFSSALDTAARLAALPELGRTYLDFAHMVIARDGKKGHQQASDLAKQAATIFTELDMRPFVQRAKALI